MVAAIKIVPSLMGQQDRQQRQREGPATGQRREMRPDPVQREKIAFVDQGRLTQAKILHQQCARTGGSKDTHHQQT